MPTRIEGVLVECDPSIKAILVKIDNDGEHAYIIEDIDDEHLLVKKEKHEELKQLLKEVRWLLVRCVMLFTDTIC
ncbi:RNA polymerase II transcription factor B subunit 5 [Teratosphaeria destructans]|uniref:General transcription and DNA repair factor IIH subunit TFB5 n=1 Tax=Teratosphaeria destructans TaxID=418781 RepID=A0A9W7W4X9_9PEZI|nr:RNA polymerase II transcription factor B subunit 5 [Teratosphaeria destructans]